MRLEKGGDARPSHREQVVFALKMPSLFFYVVISPCRSYYERRGISEMYSCLSSFGRDTDVNTVLQHHTVGDGMYRRTVTEVRESDRANMRHESHCDGGQALGSLGIPMSVLRRRALVYQRKVDRQARLRSHALVGATNERPRPVTYWKILRCGTCPPVSLYAQKRGIAMPYVGYECCMLRSIQGPPGGSRALLSRLAFATWRHHL